MNNEEKIVWLASLNFGDEVLVLDRGVVTGVAKIERVTPARIFIHQNSYHRHGNRAGQCVGDSSAWSWGSIAPVTQQAIDTLEREKLAFRMREHIQWSALSLADLRAIAAIIDKEQK